MAFQFGDGVEKIDAKATWRDLARRYWEQNDQAKNAKNGLGMSRYSSLNITLLQKVAFYSRELPRPIAVYTFVWRQDPCETIL